MFSIPYIEWSAQKKNNFKMKWTVEIAAHKATKTKTIHSNRINKEISYAPSWKAAHNELNGPDLLHVHTITSFIHTCMKTIHEIGICVRNWLLVGAWYLIVRDVC